MSIVESEGRAREQRREFLSPALGTFQAYEDPLLIERGSMQYVWGAGGRRYLDFVGQNVSISVGHCHPVVNAAVHAQVDEMVHCTTMWMHPAAAEYAGELIERMPGSDWVVHFVNSGSEAIDLAMLLARASTGRSELISLRNSFHGTQFGASTLSGIESCHQPRVAAAPGIFHVSAPDPYRGIHGADAAPYLAELDAMISASTSGRVAGFFYEPVQGFGGVTPVPSEYIDGAAARIRAAGGLVISDEVQTGFGRTGDHFWGFQAAETVPDIVVLGKGIANGFPLSAVICRRDIAESITSAKFFNTFGSNPVSVAAGRAVLEVIDKEGLQENSKLMGELIETDLDRIASDFDFIGKVRSRGLMAGVEIVGNPDSKVPDLARAQRLHEGLRELGVIVGRGGAAGNVLRIVPPMCVDSSDCGDFAEAFHTVCIGEKPL